MDNEFLLQDRLQKIQQIINQYGEENFYISFSGGKDSVVVSELIDLALPGNKIPRVYINTGIEYKLMVDFVQRKKKEDSRFIIIQPAKPIKQMLESEGYPFKSKEHSEILFSYQLSGHKKWVDGYLNKGTPYGCPEKLKYQFNENFTLKVSDHCCDELKEKPLLKWQKENNKMCAITGLMRSEGGRRSHINCILLKKDKLLKFHPIAPMNKKWEDWFISTYNIELCSLYYPPYNFSRTGCKGCPFNPTLQKDLEILNDFLPYEAKQCEIIWEPVYTEYRRINYRLKEGELND